VLELIDFPVVVVKEDVVYRDPFVRLIFSQSNIKLLRMTHKIWLLMPY